ncbi:MAG: B12-binding domain-containing radical SAM protein [Candidatus Hodarchaeales archaeon]
MAGYQNVLLLKPEFFSALGIMVNEIPHGLEYLAAMIRDIADVKIIDLCTDNREPGKIFKKLRPDLIGITTQMSWHNSTIKLVKTAKRVLPGTNIVLGGYYPTGFPSLIKMYPGIDYIIAGEGEHPFKELVEGHPPEEIKNLIYRKNGQIITNPIRPLLMDLDTLPYPARDLRNHQTSHLQFPGRIYDVITTSRGCYGHCSFCCEPGMSGSVQRFRKPVKVFDEIKWIWEFYKKKPLKITITDPNFIGRREPDVQRVETLCKLLIDAKMDIDFSCLTRADTIVRFPETVKSMVDAGIRTIEIGVESPSGGVLKNTRKGVSIRQTVKAVKIVRNAGGLPLGTMVLGFHDQPEEEIKLYPDYARKIGLIEAAFAFATPLTGTEYFREIHDKKLIIEKDFSKYDYLHPVIRNLKGISYSRMCQLLGYCYGFFYDRKKLAEGQKFYLDAQPENKNASSTKDLLVFALKALKNHSNREKMNFLKGFIEGALSSKIHS